MNRKKIIAAVLAVVLIIAMIFIIIIKNSVWKHARGGSLAENVQESEEAESVQLTERAEEEDTQTASVYEDIRPSLVHITVKQNAGTGLIWEITEQEVVIASNRHVLTGDVEAEVTFANGDKLTAYALGYSAQYDVAFFKIDITDIPQQLMQSVTEVRKPLEIALQERSQSGTAIIQAGSEDTYYEGTITQTQYMPEFGMDMLCTSCYARAGMSGGGVFDREGWLLGMVTGGEAASTGNKETWNTYSIPVTIIEEEYQTILENRINNG